MFLSTSVLLELRLWPDSSVEDAAFCQKLRTLPALSDFGIPSCGLVGGERLIWPCNEAILSLIWKVEGEFRRLEPGETSLRVVSSAIADNAFDLDVDLEMRRGAMEEDDDDDLSGS